MAINFTQTPSTHPRKTCDRSHENRTWTNTTISSAATGRAAEQLQVTSLFSGLTRRRLSGLTTHQNWVTEGFQAKVKIATATRSLKADTKVTENKAK
ncbi:hypothetical protein RRG08_017197 [Elysia crispata]|uniref:Uncharacterized protein n=1 Tax=Elysia crispata TaxID=231223 RepID=A0AAE0XV49_9GAST|nr:hypothetical protein RRG08_017197 [Elysia crispata]